MSADNPTDTTADKPVPPAPAPAETDGSADVYDPDLDELADEALSRPPIDYEEDPVPAQGGRENQGGVPAASGSAGGQEGAGQGEAGPGVTGASVVREQGGLQPSESAGPLEQEGKPPGPVTADGGGEVYDPDLDELADEALSRPPIDYDEEPVPAPARSHDLSAARGPGVPESETETTAPRRPGRENGQQDGQPAPRREPAEAETGTETETETRNSKPDADPETRTDTAAPQPPTSDTGHSADTSEEDPARPVDGMPVTPAAGTNGETPEPQTPSAERPEPSVTPAAVEHTGPREPRASEEDPVAGPPEEPATAAEAEPVPAGTTEEAFPHLEGDEEEGSYGPVSWVTLSSDDPGAEGQAPASKAAEAEEPEEPEPAGSEEEEPSADEAFKIARDNALGIDPRPSGEELLEHEGKHSRLDALKRTALEKETIENARDAINEYSDPVDKVLQRPPSGVQQDYPVNRSHYSPEVHGQLGTADVVSALLITSLLGAEGAKLAGHAAHNLVDKAHDLMERHRNASN